MGEKGLIGFIEEKKYQLVTDTYAEIKEIRMNDQTYMRLQREVRNMFYNMLSVKQIYGMEVVVDNKWCNSVKQIYGMEVVVDNKWCKDDEIVFISEPHGYRISDENNRKDGLLSFFEFKIGE